MNEYPNALSELIALGWETGELQGRPGKWLRRVTRTADGVVIMIEAHETTLTETDQKLLDIARRIEYAPQLAEGIEGTASWIEAFLREEGRDEDYIESIVNPDRQLVARYWRRIQ
jgi:hypothetical protein